MTILEECTMQLFSLGLLKATAAVVDIHKLVVDEVAGTVWSGCFSVGSSDGNLEGVGPGEGYLLVILEGTEVVRR